jgi:hypothetical protein
MNPSTISQTIGNICTVLAGILYALPLQYLLFELSRKREDGGGALAGIIILVPMWLLLLAALLCVTASGGFDWLRLSRGWLHTLAVLAIVAMAILAFARFETVPNAGRITRILVNSLIYVLPLLTILLVTINLNPRLAPGLPLKAVNLPWTICAGACLALCVGYVGYRAVAAGGNRIRGIGHTFSNNSELGRKNLATIPTLDPQRDFTELVRFTGEFQSRDVREAALAQLRRHPDFVARLATELTTATPSSGELGHALDAVEFAAFAPDEQKLLALPARQAMERSTGYIRSELRYFTKDRRKGTQRWGSRLFQSIATKFAGTGVDFQPALLAFERTMSTPHGIDPDEPAPTEPQ